MAASVHGLAGYQRDTLIAWQACTDELFTPLSSTVSVAEQCQLDNMNGLVKCAEKCFQQVHYQLCLL